MGPIITVDVIIFQYGQENMEEKKLGKYGRNFTNFTLSVEQAFGTRMGAQLRAPLSPSIR